MKNKTMNVFLMQHARLNYNSVSMVDWSLTDPDYVLIGTGSVIFKTVVTDDGLKKQKLMVLTRQRDKAEAELTEIDQQLIALRGGA